MVSIIFPNVTTIRSTEINRFMSSIGEDELRKKLRRSIKCKEGRLQYIDKLNNEILISLLYPLHQGRITLVSKENI